LYTRMPEFTEYQFRRAPAPASQKAAKLFGYLDIGPKAVII
jgi:hypothetical protein